MLPRRGRATEENQRVLTWRRPAFKCINIGRGQRTPSASIDRVPTSLSYYAAVNDGRFITDWFHGFHSSERCSGASAGVHEGTSMGCSAGPRARLITYRGMPDCQTSRRMPRRVPDAASRVRPFTASVADLRTLRGRLARMLRRGPPSLLTLRGGPANPAKTSLHGWLFT